MKNLIILLCFFIFFSCTTEEKKKLTKEAGESSAFGTSEKLESSGNSANSKSNYDTDLQLSVKLTPFIPDYPELGDAGKNLLKSRLNSAITKVGKSGESADPQFIIGPSVNLLTKDITSTTPTLFSNTYEVSLMGIDVASQTIFDTYTFTVQGVGQTPAKAFINAFKDYNFSNEAFYNFLGKLDGKIMKYYQENCDLILKKAASEAQTTNFESAFNILSNIPQEANSCYSKAIDKKEKYFQLSLNENCKTVLSSMEAELGQSKDISGSGYNPEAMYYYKMIDRSSDCFPKAEKIYKNYLASLKPELKKQWEVKSREFELQKDTIKANQEYKMAQEELKAKIEIEGNQKLIEKYQYDELPWIRQVFHLGTHDPFDRIEK